MYNKQSTQKGVLIKIKDYIVYKKNKRLNSNPSCLL